MPIPTFYNKEHLLLLLSQGTTVLTPNNRLSELILQDYVASCTHQIIDKPHCMPYGVALIKAYEQLQFINPQHAYPIVLNTSQCKHLWRNLIKSTPGITYSEGLLQSVISAWERCQQWQIHPDDPLFHYTAQTRQFQQWWQLVDQQLKKQHLITEHQLIPYLIDANSSFLSQNIVWVCFDDFTPQQVLLQEHLAQQGLTQCQYDLGNKESKTYTLAAQDTQEEHLQLMAWLHLKIHAGNQRIGVVVPQLQHESHTLQRILADHFDPALFNISLGQSLDTFPLVAHALCWLNLDNTRLNPHQASLLLQSPYLSYSKEEWMLRSHYLQEGTLLKKHRILWNHFIADLENNAPKLAKLLSNMAPYPQTATVHEWITLFRQRLNALGFPGEYALNSENYQCFNRFIALFDELRQFAILSARFTQSEALEVIQQLANDTIFQAEKTNAPIQISGLLEASGCEFDSLWVMGLTDQYLPQKVHLSAFIPPHLQRELHMPHSLPARELQLAQQILQRLQKSTDTLVLSYAQLQDDKPNLPCALISTFPEYTLLPVSDRRIHPSDLISVDECYTIPICPEERISGGTALISNQAKCPFKAFAQHRLRATVVWQTTDGLDHKERGQIIHKIMELLWQKLETQTQLLHLAPNLLAQYIDDAIHAALIPLRRQHPDLFSDSLEEVEYTRLKRLVHSCLEWEKQRDPFTIASLEQSYSMHLAGLEFQVRIDRLDQVADKKWVIDYKSSLPASKPWNEERPKESQLLLYALLDEQINSLLLLQLKNGTLSCAGFSEEKQNISGVSSLKKEETWAEYKATWTKQLTDLAAEFQQGHCPPQPANLSICQQCNFQNLCRFQD